MFCQRTETCDPKAIAAHGRNRQACGNSLASKQPDKRTPARHTTVAPSMAVAAQINRPAKRKVSGLAERGCALRPHGRYGDGARLRGVDARHCTPGGELEGDLVAAQRAAQHCHRPRVVQLQGEERRGKAGKRGAARGRTSAVDAIAERLRWSWSGRGYNEDSRPAQRSSCSAMLQPPTRCAPHNQHRRTVA